MKIIELLNKIANGEKMPENIKYEGDILKYQEDIKDMISNTKLLEELLEKIKNTSDYIIEQAINSLADKMRL